MSTAIYIAIVEAVVEGLAKNVTDTSVANVRDENKVVIVAEEMVHRSIT